MYRASAMVSDTKDYTALAKKSKSIDSSLLLLDKALRCEQFEFIEINENCE